MRGIEIARDTSAHAELYISHEQGSEKECRDQETIFDLQSSNLFTDEGRRRRGGRGVGQIDRRAKIQFGRFIFALLMQPNR